VEGRNTTITLIVASVSYPLLHSQHRPWPPEAL
jgi:hypothetical protein